MAQPVLFTEAFLDLPHGLRYIEQPESSMLSGHTAMNERQMIREADNAIGVMQFDPVSEFPAQQTDGHGGDVFVRVAPVRSGENTLPRFHTRAALKAHRP